MVIAAVFVVTTSGSSNHRSDKKKLSVSPPAAKAPLPRLQALQASWLLPAPVSRAVAIADGSGLLIAGGLDANQASSTGVYRLDLAGGLLTQTGTLALPTHDAAIASINGKPFVFGGGAQTTVDAVQALAPTGPATTAGHLPQPRSDLSTIEVGTTIYIVGGYDGSAPTT